MRIMGTYSVMMVASVALQIAFIAVFATPFGGPLNFGMPAIALSETVFYLVLDIACFVYLRRKVGRLGLKGMALSFVRSLALGALGAAAGALIVFALDATVFPLNGSIPHALGCIICGGIVSVAVTFGIAVKAGFSEAAMLVSIVSKATNRLSLRKNRVDNVSNSDDAAEIETEAVDAWNEPAARSETEACAEANGIESEASRACTPPRGRHAGELGALAKRPEQDEQDAIGRHSAQAVFERKVDGARHAPLSGRHARRGRSSASSMGKQGRHARHEDE